MAVTEFQRAICRLLARCRIEQGDSAPRVSRDIDQFHDTREALAATWESDRKQLLSHGYELEMRRERPTLPLSEVGKCVVTTRGALFQGRADDLAAALAQGQLAFHAGSIRGAMPTLGVPHS